jgi:hypothetical protein
MAKKHISGKQVVPVLNLLSSELKNLTSEELTKIFKEKELPYPRPLVTFLFNQNILQRNVKGQYTWVKQSPLYFEDVEPFLKYQRERCNPNKANKPQKQLLTEDACVQFLKSKGYKIFKPVIEHVEI